MGLVDQLKKTFFFIEVFVLAYVFVVSGLIVCFLMLLTYIFIWPWNKSLYRKAVINLAYCHWCQFTFLAQWWSGSDLTVFLEDPSMMEHVGKEHVICTMNHKYDIEWLLAWCLTERIKLLGGTKIYGKSSLRLVPLIGWAWIFTESIFLKREWEKDKMILAENLKYISEYPPGYWVSLLLFCEGTRFTEAKHKASMEVAKKKGLPPLKHHLLPRTKGFVLSVNGLKGTVKSIMDLTVAFREDIGAPPTLMSIIRGQPCRAEIYVRRIPLEDIPTDSDEATAMWLHKMFQEKDEIYEHFVQNGTFKMGHKKHFPRRINDLVVWLTWTFVLLVPLVLYLGPMFLSASWMAQLGALVFLGFATFGIRLMIAVTEIQDAAKKKKN